jgi:hypothetical protein
MAPTDAAAVHVAGTQGSAHSRLAPRFRALRIALRILAVAGPPLALTSWYLTIAATQNSFAVDFEQEFWPAARNVLNGQSPFPPVTREALSTGFAFVYPAPTALLVAPFGLLPLHAAATLFTGLLTACALLALFAVGVRDWRCYATIFLWRPILSALQTGNITLLLTLGAALLWRYRDRRTIAIVTGGALLAAKLFLWPLVIWLLATRRYAAGLGAIVLASLTTLGAWAILGFAGLHDYLPTLRLLTKLEEQTAYTPLVIGLRLGLGLESARVLGLMLAAGAVGGVIIVARRRVDEKQSFVLALVASVLCSPIVWLHYFALFIVAIGLLRPRYGPLWALPLLTILAPPRLGGPSWWAVFVLATFAALLATALLKREPRADPEEAQPVFVSS